MKKRFVFLDPDEILLDSSNLPKFDRHQLEGRLETAIAKTTLYSIGGILLVILAIFSVQAWQLQIAEGNSYRARSDKNMLHPVPLFAGRGVIYDRNGAILASNAPNESAPKSIQPDKNLAAASLSDFGTSSIPDAARREYAKTTGLAHILGYVQYPSKDANGFYYREDFLGVDGAEKYFNDILKGENGSHLIEVDAQGHVLSESVIKPPRQGGNVTLSIDSRVQSALYDNLQNIAQQYGFSGGAGVIMDIHTGEILAMTSYPEFDPQVMSDASNHNAVQSMLSDPALPFLDRAIDGLYTPGSIVKPYLALGALNEKLIDPYKIIHDTGSISIPNPYDSTKSTIFKDWKVLGDLDMRHAIAKSSDVYFYIVGGGYEGQKGLGISNIDKYLGMFGYGAPIPDSFVSSKSGTIPTPQWKKQTFNETWYLGDTYHTSIGQYGTQVTPVQVVRAVAAIANNGKLLVPTVVAGEGPRVERTIDLPQSYFDIIHEGMRLSVRDGTSVALNVSFVNIAGKSGTAELGESRQKVNSWITGYWPYENPRYAFAATLEKGSVHNLIGAATAMKQVFYWMNDHTPEYFASDLSVVH